MIMIPHTAVLFALLASTATAAPQPQEQPSPPPLRSWEITRLAISGEPYPGEARCRDAAVNTISFEVRDPNRYSGSSSSSGGTTTAKCVARFAHCAPPYGTLFSCSKAGVGNWTFSFAPTDYKPTDNTEAHWNPWQNFTLVIRLALPGEQKVTRLEAQPRISVDNNLRGHCTAVGSCSFSLKEGVAPLLVTPKAAAANM